MLAGKLPNIMQLAVAAGEARDIEEAAGALICKFKCCHMVLGVFPGVKSACWKASPAEGPAGSGVGDP